MPKVKLTTTLGEVVLELDEDKAPISTRNMVDYVESGHYSGTVFHRVIDGFMIQGGGYEADLKKREPKAPIANEATNGLKNLRGTVAMARTPEINSATSQFFINVVDNAFLDHRDESEENYGYAVIGRVCEGMDVVDRIKSVKTGAKGPFQKDCPLEVIAIESATVISE